MIYIALIGQKSKGSGMMTIEQEFFEAFGIEAKLRPNYCKREGLNCRKNEYFILSKCHELQCENFKPEYAHPPITPEIVLNLQVILCNFHSEHECCLLITGNSIENITINILKDCIELKDYIQAEVRGLFNEQ